MIQRRTEKVAQDDGDKHEHEEKKEELEKKLSSTTPKGRKSVLVEKRGPEHEVKEPKMETRKYFRTYEIEFGEKIDYEDEDKLIFEGYMMAAEKKEKHGKEKKEKKGKKAEEELDKIKNDPMTGILMGTLAGQPYNAGLN